MAVVTTLAARSLHPGVISTMHLGIKYYSSSLDKSYGSWEDWPNPAAFAESKNVAAHNLFGLNGRPSSLFGTVCVLHILQKCLRVLGIIWSIVISIDMHSLVPLQKWSQPPDRIKDMGWHAQNTSLWSYFSILFRQHMSHKLHGEVWVFLPLSILLGHSSHNAIHMIEHVIVDSDNVMQSYFVPFWHPQGAVVRARMPASRCILI